MDQLFIGIDSGTTAIKAVVMDLNGNEIYKKAFNLTAICPRQDMYEESMDEIWNNAYLALKDVAAHFEKKQIVGIGITAQGDGLWLIDKDGNPVRNGCCFCDGRAGEIVDEWVAEGVCDRLFSATGTWLFSGNQNGIVKWMERNEPEALAKAAYCLHLKDYLFYKLTGKITSDATDQSLVFLDQKKRDYSEEAFEICGLAQYRSKYPPVLSAKENAFRIKEDLAKELNLNPDILVTSGPMDVSACALGSGVTEPGDCCSIMGTAALHEMVIDTPLCDSVRSGMTVSHVMENRWLRLMASLAGTPNLDWVINTLAGGIKQEAASKRINVFSMIENMIQSVPVGSHGVMYHPYLLAGGERAPFTDASAKASFTNINVTHTTADILHSVYEGVALAMMDCYKHMPYPMKKITVCGGGAGSAYWCQMFSDAMGMELITVNGEELGAKGVVLNNAVVQGYYADYESAVRSTVTVRDHYYPDMKKHDQYEQLYQLYLEISQALRKSWKLNREIISKLS